MPEFKLSRTDEPPALITGELIGQFKSSNTTAAGYQQSRQWFEIDVYTTTKGTWVAHVRYRAGERIRREKPRDIVILAKSAAELVDKLDAFKPVEEFVTGWPEGGAPAANDGRDLRRNHADVCRYAEEQWKDIVDKISDATDAEAPEIIE